MNELPSIYIIIAALSSGAVLGFNLVTETERQRRSFKNPPLHTSLLSIVFKQAMWLLVVSTVMTIVALSIMKMGETYPLSQVEKYFFVGIWFLSIAFTKYLRYCYWKKK